MIKHIIIFLVFVNFFITLFAFTITLYLKKPLWPASFWLFSLMFRIYLSLTNVDPFVNSLYLFYCVMADIIVGVFVHAADITIQLWLFVLFINVCEALFIALHHICNTQ
jgi:hypothetical protein